MKINQIIVDESVQLGDNFDIELNNLIIESCVVGFMDDGVVIEADDKALALLGLSGALLESVSSGNTQSRQGVGEASKLQGTPVVSLSDFSDKDNTKNKYGQTVPKKLKPNDPRVKFLKGPKKQGVTESSLNEGQYEMMMRNGQVKKFVAKDDADAKRIANGHGAKSVIRLKGGVPAGKVSEQGVAEGSGKNVVKSIKVGNFRHDLVDTGMGWQVRIYNGDELYDTGLSKNSEQKGLAALEDAVAYTEKQINTKRQGVAEGRFDNSLTGWHIVYRKSSNPVHATPSFETKEQAQKYLMTKMFANHQDYKVVHTAGVGVSEETELDEAIDFKKEAAKHMKDLHDKNSTPANKAYAQKMLRRALEAAKMKDKAGAAKHYMGVAEGHWGWDDPQYDKPKLSDPHAEEPRRDDTDDAPTKTIYRVWDGKKYVGDREFDRVEDAIAFRASLPGGKDMSIQQAKIYVTPDTDWEASDRDDEADYMRDKFRHGDFNEAEYQGRKVPLGKPMRGDVKKSKVYVKGPKGNVVKVNFGDKNMKIKKSNPKRRKSFRARHNCANPGPRWKARYWSCRAW